MLLKNVCLHYVCKDCTATVVVYRVGCRINIVINFFYVLKHV